jgi:hypothetical protein
MRHFRFALVAVGSVLAAAGVLLACTSDDTVVTDDAGADTGTGPETGTTDSGVDAGEKDAEPDVLVDAGLTFPTFREQLANSFCRSIARCCFGDSALAHDAGVDGGFFDRDSCLSLARSAGFEGSNLFNEDAGTPLVLNQAQALECVAKVDAIACQLGRAEFVAARSACFNAVRGTAVAGDACATGIDCVPGTFCNRTTSKCENLRGDDAGCGDFIDDTYRAEEACSWRGSGDTNRFCDSWDFAQQAPKPQAEWRCRPAVATGERCLSSPWCADGLCDDRNDLDNNGENDYVCRSPITYFPRTPDFCDSLVKP